MAVVPNDRDRGWSLQWADEVSGYYNMMSWIQITPHMLSGWHVWWLLSFQERGSEHYTTGGWDHLWQYLQNLFCNANHLVHQLSRRWSRRCKMPEVLGWFWLDALPNSVKQQTVYGNINSSGGHSSSQHADPMLPQSLSSIIVCVCVSHIMTNHTCALIMIGQNAVMSHLWVIMAREKVATCPKYVGKLSFIAEDFLLLLSHSLWNVRSEPGLP